MASSTPGCSNPLCDMPTCTERQRWRNGIRIRPGNVYSIKMSVYAPLFAQAQVALDEFRSFYIGNRKGPRPCVVIRQEEGDFYVVCLMATFGGTKPFDDLDEHFRDRTMPVYCRRANEPAIVRGDRHIHTTPDWDCNVTPQFILPITVLCHREQLGDWPVPRNQKENTSATLHGPTRAPFYYLDSLYNGAFGTLKDEIDVLETKFHEEYGEDEVKRQQWVDELYILRERVPHSLYTSTVYSRRSAVTKRTTRTSQTKMTNMTSCTEDTEGSVLPNIASVLMDMTGMALDESSSEQRDRTELAPQPTPSGRKLLRGSLLPKSGSKSRLSFTSFHMTFRSRKG